MHTYIRTYIHIYKCETTIQSQLVALPFGSAIMNMSEFKTHFGAFPCISCVSSLCLCSLCARQTGGCKSNFNSAAEENMRLIQWRNITPQGLTQPLSLVSSEQYKQLLMFHEWDLVVAVNLPQCDTPLGSVHKEEDFWMLL